MTIHKGKVHDYLGIKLGHHESGKVKMDTTDYLKNILDDLPRKYLGKTITSAENHLFEVNKTTLKLSERDTQSLHTIVDKLLFLYKRARPDILTGVAFLTTQVRDPRKDDDKKLGHIINYLSKTRDLVLTLESNCNVTINGGWTPRLRCNTILKVTPAA